MRRLGEVTDGRQAVATDSGRSVPGVRGFGLSRRGTAREGNEDAMLVGGGADGALFAVADGMGGHAAGEVASRLAIESLEDSSAETLAEAAHRANGRIFEVRSEGAEGRDLAGMGTTLVALRFAGHGGGLAAEVAHVGDSRAYLFRDGLLVPLTEDHSFVNSLVRGGVIGREEASRHPRRNALNRALGTGDARADAAILEALSDDRVLLCSDGLHDVAPERAVAELLGRTRGGPGQTACALVSAAVRARGTDDVTAVVADVGNSRVIRHLREVG